MYCCKKSRITSLPDDQLKAKQELFEKLLPEWEARIFTVSRDTFPKVDQGLMEIDDIRQEIRSAVWEGIVAFQPERLDKNGMPMSIESWIYKIIERASGLIAHLQWYAMPRINKKAVQLVHFGPTDDHYMGDRGGGQIEAVDPESIERIEREALADVELWTKRAKEVRALLTNDFQRTVFDLLMEGNTAAEVGDTLNVCPQRISNARHKMRIAFALLSGTPLSKVSKAKDCSLIAKQTQKLIDKHRSAIATVFSQEGQVPI